MSSCAGSYLQWFLVSGSQVWPLLLGLVSRAVAAMKRCGKFNGEVSSTLQSVQIDAWCIVAKFGYVGVLPSDPVECGPSLAPATVQGSGGLPVGTVCGLSRYLLTCTRVLVLIDA